MTKDKVDLTLVKKLIGELEISINIAERVAESDKDTYFIEMSKSAGLAAGVMQEASLLIIDIYAVANSNQPSTQKAEFLNNPLFGTIKGGGFGNTN